MILRNLKTRLLCIVMENPISKEGAISQPDESENFRFHSEAGTAPEQAGDEDYTSAVGNDEGLVGRGRAGVEEDYTRTSEDEEDAPEESNEIFRIDKFGYQVRERRDGICRMKVVETQRFQERFSEVRRLVDHFDTGVELRREQFSSTEVLVPPRVEVDDLAIATAQRRGLIPVEDSQSSRQKISPPNVEERRRQQAFFATHNGFPDSTTNLYVVDAPRRPAPSERGEQPYVENHHSDESLFSQWRRFFQDERRFFKTKGFKGRIYDRGRYFLSDAELALSNKRKTRFFGPTSAFPVVDEDRLPQIRPALMRAVRRIHGGDEDVEDRKTSRSVDTEAPGAVVPSSPPELSDSSKEFLPSTYEELDLAVNEAWLKSSSRLFPPQTRPIPWRQLDVQGKRVVRREMHSKNSS